jgi:23S rRNA (cytidine2498-2'-O)-methyltransferase
VDWLLCDVIAAPGRSIELLMNWVRQRWARRFVVTVKFKGHADYPVLDRLKQDLPPLCSEILVTRLCANKNEACAAGIVADP